MRFFFCDNLDQDLITLSKEESKHCVKVLRKREGDLLYLTDGKGTVAEARLADTSQDECVAQIVSRTENYGRRPASLNLAVAPTKNHDRMEWLVEKIIEIGCEKISFLRCDHSEREKVDFARLERIAIAALKQSNTAYLPKMELIDYKDFINTYAQQECDKFIACCTSPSTEQLAAATLKSPQTVVLIGPEGDFSEEELEAAAAAGFTEVKLGSRRLRTETAALYACCIFAGKLEENK